MGVGVRYRCGQSPKRMRSDQALVGMEKMARIRSRSRHLSGSRLNMCTVTFIPRDVGYYLAMNRDEKLSRIAGLPPKRQFIDGCTVLFPSEPGGGTWISA